MAAYTDYVGGDLRQTTDYGQSPLNVDPYALEKMRFAQKDAVQAMQPEVPLERRLVGIHGILCNAHSLLDRVESGPKADSVGTEPSGLFLTTDQIEHTAKHLCERLARLTERLGPL